MALLYLFIGFFSVVLLPLVVTLAEEVITRWKYRHLPGPAQKWLTGNMTEVLRGGLLPTVGRWISRYGGIFKFRLAGRLFVVVSDPDAVRTVMCKLTNHAPISNLNSNLVAGDLRAIDVYGLASAKDDYWRTVRTAWQPAFAPASLRGYQSLMDREALALVGRLEARAGAQRPQPQGGKGPAAAVASDDGGRGSGGSGGSDLVEMLEEMSRTTLAVVGTAAYGVDFTSPEYGGSGARRRGGGGSSVSAGGELSLVQACSDWFRTMALSYRSKWALAAAFPRFLPLLRHLACAFPDAALAVHIRARRVIGRTSQRLIDGWRLAHNHHNHLHQQRQQQGDKPTTAAIATSTAENVSTAAVANATAARPAGGGVAPGSFLGLLLAAGDKNRGRGLSDLEIAAQVQTFMLAGFETTANALTFAVYHLALHPDKAAALRRELDDCLPPPLPPPPGLRGEGEGEGEGEEVEAEVPPLTGEVLEKLVYTEAVIQEAMRLHPPAHSVSRISDKPIKVLEYDIPAGTSFFIPIRHLHQDDKLWPDAQAFRPERFLPSGAGKVVSVAAAEGGGGGGGFGFAAPGDNPFGPRHPHVYQPFGAGSRMCVGWRFAMQEAKTVLARLFQRFDFELAPGQVPLETATGLTLAPAHGVLVRVSRRGV